MWEDRIWHEMRGRPRYQFDMISPVIDNIIGGFEKTVFNAKVTATRGGDKAGVKLRQGLLRSIQNWSDAPIIYKNLGRKYIMEGFGAFCVDFDYLDQDTFDKDLILKEIKNAIDRVWLDPGSEKQDGSDANWSCEIQSVLADEFDTKFPDKDKSSFDTGVQYEAYSDKRTVINIVKFYYREPVDRELVLMSDGSIYEAEEYEKLKGQMEEMGKTEVKRRKRTCYKVKCRYMSGTEWLTKPFDTPFEYQPIVPVYNQFDIVEDKIVWNRPVEKMMPAQRVINYAKSREVEEVALAPRKKIWLTPKQMKGHAKTLSTLNTNPNPVQEYNADQEIGNQIVTTGGPEVNPALINVYTGAQQSIEQTSGMFAASMGKNPNDQSGEALKVLEARGDMGNSSIYKDMEIAITQAMRICMKAMAEVYDANRQVPVTEESGAVSIEDINQPKSLMTPQGMKSIIMNDLSDTSYDCTVEMSATYRTQQEEANEAILAAASLDPTILQTSMDIFLGNIDAAGIDQIQERVRDAMFSNGQIPPEQMTDDERQKMQQQQAQAQQNQQPDPMLVAAMAEDKKAQAEVINAQTNQQESQIDMFNAETKRIEAMTKAQEAGVKIEGMMLDNQLKFTEKQLDAADKAATIEGKQIDNAAKMDDMSIQNATTAELIRVLG